LLHRRQHVPISVEHKGTIVAEMHKDVNALFTIAFQDGRLVI
jgi:hypothetical protein